MSRVETLLDVLKETNRHMESLIQLGQCNTSETVVQARRQAEEVEKAVLAAQECPPIPLMGRVVMEEVHDPEAVLQSYRDREHELTVDLREARSEATILKARLASLMRISGWEICPTTGLFRKERVMGPTPSEEKLMARAEQLEIDCQRLRDELDVVTTQLDGVMSIHEIGARPNPALEKVLAKLREVTSAHPEAGDEAVVIDWQAGAALTLGDLRRWIESEAAHA